MCCRFALATVQPLRHHPLVVDSRVCGARQNGLGDHFGNRPMNEDEVFSSNGSDPDTLLEEDQDESIGDFSRMMILMSLETELRALVRKMKAGLR
jgi:hypothetical protein